jgi:hypothetical protein
MLIDMSAMPRFFTLGATALGLNENVAEYVDVLYSEATYGKSFDLEPVAIPEHVGGWEALAVPRLEGDWYPGSSRHFLVSVGFEANKVARLADRWDPDIISVLFPRPGTGPDHEERALRANADWIRQFDVPESRILDCSPSDAVLAWKTIARHLDVNVGSENVYCLLCGPKPHALGMALFAMSRERPAVMYVRPTLHEEKDISPNGTFWRYRLRDRTLLAPSAKPA